MYISLESPHSHTHTKVVCRRILFPFFYCFYLPVLKYYDGVSTSQITFSKSPPTLFFKKCRISHSLGYEWLDQRGQRSWKKWETRIKRWLNVYTVQTAAGREYTCAQYTYDVWKAKHKRFTSQMKKRFFYFKKINPTNLDINELPGKTV